MSSASSQNWFTYSEQLKEEAVKASLDEEKINALLLYAQPLFRSGLPIIYDKNHLSQLVGYNTEYIDSVTQYSKAHYKLFKIKKKSGSDRPIAEPLTSLKEIQYWLLCNILEKVPVSKFAKAYIKGVSIKDNARFHRNRDKVLTIDISNFFGAIRLNMVTALFRKIGYNNDISLILSNLCCLNGALPQGAPTSAAISNIVMFEIDAIISVFCQSRGIRYTRYADDMTFSFDNNIPEGMIIKRVSKILIYNNFRVNKSKLRLMERHQRQSVTGIVVNSKLQVESNLRRDLRQIFYYIKKFGLSEHLSRVSDDVQDRKKYILHILGRCNFVIFINPNDEEFYEYKSIAHAYLMSTEK